MDHDMAYNARMGDALLRQRESALTGIPCCHRNARNPVLAPDEKR